LQSSGTSQNRLLPRDRDCAKAHYFRMSRQLPSGSVTLLFTDIEGSTKLLHELGAEAYAEALAEHRMVLREAFARHGGIEMGTEGDAFFVAFPTAPGALQAAREAQEALGRGLIRVRMGVHTGTPQVTEEGYVGLDVHKAARIAAAGHGGQVLLSRKTRELAEAPVTDLGEHRLKDFDEPVWIFQLGSERFPPLKTISNTNLPRPASSFVGRGREVEEVVSLFKDGARLVTLTGPGGSGKTRLAIEAAAQLVPEFKAGVFWVGLAPLRDPALVIETAARTLGAKDGLAEHIGERELLLLLDNLEQVVEATPDLASLVEACPHLRLLVTSRELLRVRGEVEYPVQPLADPEAVELFSSRSRVEPDETMAELCRRLDNLPLAIELAAARTSVLSPAQIRERLSKRLDLLKGGRDAEARQRTLRATIEWSHDLLPLKERRLFARLSVFRGGCTLEAAEEICEADLDVLQSLVDKSLLRRRDDRFWMLETIREFGVERLEESGEGLTIRRRHADHFTALAESAYPNLMGSPGTWLDRLEAEHDNLRAAMDWLEASDNTQGALWLAGTLYRFWFMRAHLAEGARRLERLLTLDHQPTPARGRALLGAAVMATNVGDTVTTRLRAEEALGLHRALGDAWGVAYSVLMLSNAATDEGDFERARTLTADALARFRDVGDKHYIVVTLNGLAHIHGELGDLERERALHEEALGLARADSNERMVARTLYSLAWHAVIEGRTQDSIAMVKEALDTYLRLGEVAEVSMGLRRFAWALAVEDRAVPAAQLLSQAEALREEIGASLEAWAAEMDEKTLARIHEQLDDASAARAWEQGRKLTVDEAVVLALRSGRALAAEEVRSP
jgi:predicted ATPase/class 3 adenylate cyclase